MSEASANPRYLAQTLEHGDRAHVVPEARSFAEAAVLFAEGWHPATEADGAVSVTVTDCDSGEQHCFTVHLDSGDVESCASDAPFAPSAQAA